MWLNLYAFRIILSYSEIPEILVEKYVLRISGIEKLSFFEMGILDLLIPMKNL